MPKKYKPHHERFSVAWYERRRALHLRRYPDCDQVTRDNLDMLVVSAREGVYGDLRDEWANGGNYGE